LLLPIAFPVVSGWHLQREASGLDAERSGHLKAWVQSPMNYWQVVSATVKAIKVWDMGAPHRFMSYHLNRTFFLNKHTRPELMVNIEKILFPCNVTGK
jgi:hypothetical protein